MLNELKAMSIRIGDVFTLNDSLGDFERGEEVTVRNVKFSGEDKVVTLVNAKGVKDIFYFDKNDEV